MTVGYYTSKEDELVNYTLRDYTRIGWAAAGVTREKAKVLKIFMVSHRKKFQSFPTILGRGAINSKFRTKI